MPVLRRRRDALTPERVWLHGAALEAMTAEADNMAPDETGGMVLGYVSGEHGRREAVVESVIGPGPDAIHESGRFEPDGKWQRSELARIYFESRSATYLGDWHSHPGGGPTASRLDEKTAASIARRRRARTPHPLMIILHGERGGWEAVAYCYWDRNLMQIPLKLFG